MTADIIVRTSTGKYHMGRANSSIMHCNYIGQVKPRRPSPARERYFNAAPDSMFCKKCFPNGKPAAFRCAA